MSGLSYGFETTLEGLTFESAVGRTRDALKEGGFGVLTEIDVKETLKKKLDIDFRNYMILGACNPHLAHQALEAEPQIGLLLPCNAVVQEAPDGTIAVSIADPKAMFKVVDNSAMAAIAEEAETRIRNVIRTLEGSH